MTSSVQIVDDKLVEALSLQDQDETRTTELGNELGFGNHGGCCAICLDTIPLQETAMVKGCEHAYCVTCILRWASYKEKHTCPQCKLPFDFLNVHRTLDGSVEDFMFEESVCLLLGASWFQPLQAVERVSDNDIFNSDFNIPPLFGFADEDDDDLDEFMHDSRLLYEIRRRGANSAGRQEASQASAAESGPSSREPKEKLSKAGKRAKKAKKAMKREAANKAAEAVRVAKHHMHLLDLGRT